MLNQSVTYTFGVVHIDILQIYDMFMTCTYAIISWCYGFRTDGYQPFEYLYLSKRDSKERLNSFV